MLHGSLRGLPETFAGAAGRRSTVRPPRRRLHGTIELARGSGVEVIVLHVREEQRLPPFSDHLQHEARAWANEFIARTCPPEDVKLELRVGVPHEHVVGVAQEMGVDVVALGWNQSLAAGRAAVVPEALARCPVPILLVPVNEVGEGS